MLNLFQHLKLTRFETLKQACLLQSDSGLHFQVVQQNLLIGEHKRMRYSTKTLILIMFFFQYYKGIMLLFQKHTMEQTEWFTSFTA